MTKEVLKLLLKRQIKLGRMSEKTITLKEVTQLIKGSLLVMSGESKYKMEADIIRILSG